MELTLTHIQGNQLLAFMGAGLVFPEKLGKEEFEPAMRAFANDEMGKARKALLAYSELWALKRKVLFGKAENWRCRDESKDFWGLVDPNLEIDVRVDEDEEQRGFYWALVLMLHPSSPVHVGIDVQSETCWPLAEQLGYVKDLREITGLSQRKLPRLPKKDSDPTWKAKPNGNGSDKKVDLSEKPKEETAAKA